MTRGGPSAYGVFMDELARKVGNAPRVDDILEDFNRTLASAKRLEDLKEELAKRILYWRDELERVEKALGNPPPAE